MSAGAGPGRDDVACIHRLEPGLITHVSPVLERGASDRGPVDVDAVVLADLLRRHLEGGVQPEVGHHPLQPPGRAATAHAEVLVDRAASRSAGLDEVRRPHVDRPEEGLPLHLRCPLDLVPLRGQGLEQRLALGLHDLLEDTRQHEPPELLDDAVEVLRVVAEVAREEVLEEGDERRNGALEVGGIGGVHGSTPGTPRRTRALDSHALSAATPAHPATPFTY